MGNSFAGHGLCIEGLVYLSPREALPFLEGSAILVDLREGLEMNGREFKVKNVVSLPFRELEASHQKLPRDQPLILADCVGLKSKEGIRFLVAQGYESVASLNGGMVDWAAEGFPTNIDHGEELTGSCVCQLRPKKAYRSGC